MKIQMEIDQVIEGRFVSYDTDYLKLEHCEIRIRPYHSMVLKKFVKGQPIRVTYEGVRKARVTGNNYHSFYFKSLTGSY